MKERPILMSTPMVQATYARRKTHTRRMNGLDVVNEWPSAWAVTEKMEVDKDGRLIFSFHNTNDNSDVEIVCPYGKPGDQLWVREASAVTHSTGPSRQRTVWYKADDPVIPPNVKFKWKPSIHMLKSSARIWLEIEEVRVERLQDISEEDAKKEGVERIHGNVFSYKNYLMPESYCADAITSFRTLWQSINGEDSWKENPWVWVVQFNVKSLTGKVW